MLTSPGALTFNPKSIIGPGLVEWWTTLDISSMSTKTDGSTKVASDGDLVAQWKGQRLGLLAIASGNAAADPYRTNRLGRRAAVAFSGSNNGLIGSYTHSYPGATIIVFGRFTAQSATFRTLVSIGPDLVSDPSQNANGIWLGAWDAAGALTLVSNAIVTGDVTVANSTPVMVVATLNQSITNSVNIAGISTGQVIQKLWINGGNKPATYAFNTNTGVIAAASFSIGGRTDTRFGVAFDVCDVILTDGELSGLQLQSLNDLWVQTAGGFAGVI